MAGLSNGVNISRFNRQLNFSSNKKAHLYDGLFIPRFREDKFNLGNDLLSHTVSHAVPSALKGLTSVFGMGTGVSPSLWSPRNL